MFAATRRAFHVQAAEAFVKARAMPAMQATALTRATTLVLKAIPAVRALVLTHVATLALRVMLATEPPANFCFRLNPL
jgi:hypothetical protein